MCRRTWNDPSAATVEQRVYDVVVLPDRIWATSEAEARAEFIKALTEDGGLIRVSEALDE